MTNRSLGKDKAPICIELHKPPLDPAFEEEMKIVRYAMLISKVKTILEKEHQNDPNRSVSGLKDEQGQEIDTTEDEEDEDRDDDVEDADDENDDNDDDNNDDDNDGNNGANLMYDSPSPLLKSSSNSDSTRETSQQDEDVSTNHPEDLSRALVPHVQPMDETPIKREEAVVNEGKLEASPILLSSGSGGKRDAPLQGDQVETPQTNIEEDSPPVSPRVVMNLMRETVHAAETIHQQYLILRQRDTKVLEDLSKKVDQLMAAQAQPRPPPPEPSQPPPQDHPDKQFHKRVAKELHELHTAVNKVARQQHELKHSHFSLK
ncbi:PREDICTED: transcription elongation factor SPT5-like [Ipomoea nil]|uniref:transcription elongation factor SPT5-like n=1 Tax=Ipomoea nil TaxID=35883 RepID=UPI0009015A17|nr:PREDICTED: transcription elongation factor SPT5-like [Ipomoea nil]